MRSVVNFELARNRLIRFVSLRIRNGDRTERQLAKLVGVSQPQLHNVLKGVRPLKGELADALLAHFQISLLDLLELEEGRRETAPLVASPFDKVAEVRRRPGRADSISTTRQQAKLAG